MNEHKLKVVLAVLVGIFFAFVFIILAFVLPAKEEEALLIKKPANILEEVSQSLRE
ncbi:hypothetical protein [Sulfurimonas sp.]|uniref:hypothetical protein n=1 Tax=Sulfurimonas sp. TaxID=2022749 RepID=UPI003D135CEC